MMFFRTLFALLATLAVPIAAHAQTNAASPQLRAIDVPANASWQHAETGMIMPSRIAGLARETIGDSTDGEQDVVITYTAPAEGLVVTIYIYRTGTPDVPVWFDRALGAIPGSQDIAPAPVVTPFARPGASVPSGLRTFLPSAVPGMRSTALALAPMGEWLVKFRVSSANLDPAALDERLSALIVALRWPAQSGPAFAAMPVTACERPLRLRQARLVRSTMADTLLSAVLTGPMRRDGEAERPPVYCRDPGASQAYGVYRPGGTSRSYLIALGDSGIALSVGPSISLAALSGGNAAPQYGVSLLGRDSTSVLPSFDRLPPPEQAFALWRSGGTVLSVTTGNR